MYTDPRGGHNKKKFNEDFFKTWTPSMAYILGFICADGAVIDARKSSRTCYICIHITDRDLLSDIRTVISSSHNIYTYPQKYTKFKTKTYLCKESYRLRFGSKEMFQDLVNLGVTPRKSLRLRLPSVPKRFFHFFVRGYFDGDGCVFVYKPKDRKRTRVQAVFTTGCSAFAEALASKFKDLLHIEARSLFSGNGAYQLRYHDSKALIILKYMYKDLKMSPFLERKHNIYLKALKNI